MKNIRLFITIIFATLSLNTNAMVTKKPCKLPKDFLKDLATAILENPNEKNVLYKELSLEIKKELLKAEKKFDINKAIHNVMIKEPGKREEIISLTPRLILAGFIKQELTDFLLEEFGTANPRPFKVITGTLPQAFTKAISVEATNALEEI